MEERNSKEAWMEYKKSRKSAKRVISSAKEKKQKECASDLNDPEHQNEIFRMAKQMVKERQDITGSNCLKGVLCKVIVDEKGIMNEENEWDHGISAEVKEGPADCIMIDEVVTALKKMKRHKAPGLSQLSAEMIQATERIGTQWLLDLCNGIVKKVAFQRIGSQVSLQRERWSGVWIL